MTSFPLKIAALSLFKIITRIKRKKNVVKVSWHFISGDTVLSLSLQLERDFVLGLGLFCQEYCYTEDRYIGVVFHTFWFKS